MSEMGRKSSLWMITTPEAIAWSVNEFYKNPKEELQQRIQRAHSASDDDAIMMFEAALHLLNTCGPPAKLLPVRRKTFH